MWERLSNAETGVRLLQEAPVPVGGPPCGPGTCRMVLTETAGTAHFRSLSGPQQHPRGVLWNTQRGREGKGVAGPVPTASTKVAGQNRSPHLCRPKPGG